MNSERVAIFDCLYRRVGELTAHLGRYDLQLLVYARMLTDESVLIELFEAWPIDEKIEVICRLLQARNCPASLQQQLRDVHQQLKPVLERQRICASHPAVATQIGVAHHWGSGSELGSDWSNRTGVTSLHEVNEAVASLENDILTAVKLYLALASLAARVENILLQPVATPAS